MDKLGGVDVALDQIRELAKIDPKQKLHMVYPEPKKRTLLEVIGSGAAESLMRGMMEKMPGLEQMQSLGLPKGSKGLYFL